MTDRSDNSDFGWTLRDSAGDVVTVYRQRAARARETGQPITARLRGSPGGDVRCRLAASQSAPTTIDRGVESIIEVSTMLKPDELTDRLTINLADVRRRYRDGERLGFQDSHRIGVPTWQFDRPDRTFASIADLIAACGGDHRGTVRHHLRADADLGGASGLNALRDSNAQARVAAVQRQRTQTAS